MDIFIELHLFTYLYFSLFLHLRSFLGVQVTAGRDSNNLVFEGFSRHIQKLSLCFSTRQPIPMMGWITCEWADDYMTPTQLKRHCVVLVAPLTLVFLSLAVVGLFLHRSFMVKEAPLHLQVFCESSTLNLWFGQLYISFWAHYFMLKDRIGTFVFIEAAMIMRVVGKMKLAILIVSIAIWKKKNSPNSFRKLQESSKN